MIEQQRHRLEKLEKQLKHPHTLLQQQAQHIDWLMQRLTHATQQKITAEKTRLIHTTQMLNAFNPLNTLGRGFSITRKNGHVMRSIDAIQPGDTLETQFADGSIKSKVLKDKD